MISNADFFGELIRNTDKIKTVTNNKAVSLFNVPAAFDIETSSFYMDELKTAIMYEWTFGIGYMDNGELKTIITYGRTWDSFFNLVNAVSVLLKLNPVNRRLVVYVHNLPYEWQWFRKRFSWTKVFFLDDRKPVYAITSNGIEFRCSLKLSGKSLANTAKDLIKYKAKKMVGDLDYSLIRHSKTPLSDLELGYCENDVKVLLCYIQEKIEQDGSIIKIPLTKTSYVRRFCKNAMFQNLEDEEGKGVLEDEDPYEELNAEAVGVYPAERMFRGRIYPREHAENGYDSQESWFIRLYEFLSCGDGSGTLSDV